MVVICDTPFPNESKYEPHFDLFPYPLSDFQKYSILAVVEGHHSLITAHTGSGKSLPAEFAIQYFASNKKKVIYISPIKADFANKQSADDPVLSGLGLWVYYTKIVKID